MMERPVPILLCVLVALIAACQTVPVPRQGTAWNGAGEPVLVYLQPLPPAAERLRLTIAGLAAERDDGGIVPLPLALQDLDGQRTAGQRLLAAAPLPAGAYRGLLLTFAAAALRTGDGDAALLVPEGPVPIPEPFRVVRGQALVLALALRPTGSLRSGFSFTPSFTLAVPERTVTGLAGLVVTPVPPLLSLFDKRRQEVTAAVVLAGAPSGVAADGKERQAYVAEPAEDAVEIIDLVDGRIVGRLRLNPGDEPQDVATAGDDLLLVANSGSATVSVIDVRSRYEAARIAVGQGPRFLAVDREGRRAYVSNALGDSVSVIDVPNRAVVATIAVEPGPRRCHLSRDGDRLYVIGSGSPYLSVIDTRSLAVLRREFIGMGASAVSVDRRTNLLYVANERERSVSVYDPLSFAAVERIATAGAVTAMAIDGDENVLYVVIPGQQRIEAVNLVRARPLGGIDAAGAPVALSLVGGR